jgi:hypothetical protein
MKFSGREKTAIKRQWANQTTSHISKMLSTLHSCSQLAVKSDLELWTLPQTQISHTGDEIITLFPLSKIGLTDAIEFYCPNTSQYYLDLSSALVHFTADVVRVDGTATTHAKPASILTEEEKKLLKANESETHVHDSVSIVDGLGFSAFSSVDVTLNDTTVSSHASYPYRAYFDTLLNSNMSLEKGPLLYPIQFTRDSSKFDLEKDEALRDRYNNCKASREFEVISPVFSDVFQMDRLLISGVDMRITFRQSPNTFRLWRSATETHDHLLRIKNMKLTLRRVKIADTVMVAHESAIKQANATYLLRGIRTKLRSMVVGERQFRIENIGDGKVPSRILVAFVKTTALHGAYSDSPYKFEPLKIRSAVLTVGSKTIEDTFNFEKGIYGEAYMRLIRSIENPHLRLSSKEYANNTFFLLYNTDPDCNSSEVLSPVRNENVRLTIQLADALAESHTMLIITEDPRIMEITSNREVKLT